MIQRDLYMEQIRPFIDKDIIKVMTGIRRCGKSVMLKLIQDELISEGKDQKNMLFLNFESKLLPFHKTVNDTFDYIKDFILASKEKKYLFLDEIQDLDNWEDMINALMIDFDVDIYITGSNARLLSSELSTYLSGRYIEIKIYPFSYNEVKLLMSSQNSNLTDSQIFYHYLQYGGMPFTYQNSINDDATLQYLEDVFDSIIIKDVTQRNNIRDIALFKKVLIYFIADIGHTYSATSIRKYLKSENRSISTETLYNYIEYCKEACFLHLVSRMDLVGKKILQFQEKIYLVDHGFRESIYGSNLRDINQTLENIIYMELLRRGYDVHIGKFNQYEVDFVVSKTNQKCYIQVAYILADESTVEREFRSLELIKDNYPKYVITMDEIDQSRNGIKHMNIKDFLSCKDIF